MERSQSGYRYYDLESAKKLRFIHSVKELGFTLSEIKDLISIQVSKNGKCSLALEKIREKEKNIDKKISELKRIKNALRKVSKKCESSNSDNKCHFLELIGK